MTGVQTCALPIFRRVRVPPGILTREYRAVFSRPEFGRSYGAMAYYLANQTEVDKYLQIQESDSAESSQQNSDANRSLHKKLEAAKPSPARK